MTSPRIYGELADWYLLLTAPEDYAEEARWYADRLCEHARRPVREVLELGCGSGANASHMKAWFEELVLVDLSPEMLAICARLNPELARHQGDMRTFRIDRRFDAVFVHDAASYLTTAADLRAAVETAALHLRPGGVVMFCPDDVRESFRPGVETGGHDGEDGRALRYLEWSRPGPDDDTVTIDRALLLRHPDGEVEVVHDSERTGRLSTETWLEALREARLDARCISFEHSEVEPGSLQVFVGGAPPKP